MLGQDDSKSRFKYNITQKKFLTLNSQIKSPAPQQKFDDIKSQKINLFFKV